MSAGQRLGRSSGAGFLAIAGVLSAVALLAGCSQVAAIAPVGGNHLSEVRYAAIDVLTTAGTPLLTAPVCDSTSDGTVTCAGTTTTGDPITVLSTAADPATVTVTVGTSVLYAGSITDVLDAAARATS
ncbi:hypothetical protein B7R54_06000 [Subtercola boreus]|uniref:DUF4333 domain-containing protein n=1 Tax=Subtercola boreus TaxID=120213 RepID=A0A3E0VIZ3_9MICO|nr:hypothetical protein [Subtercola boreus]RFA08827.1 hypothetical protein B7R54_06000 [Subtercola boreus]TQL54204.1 hypothetical protein FB464_1734 [Subtercola boreus]